MTVETSRQLSLRTVYLNVIGELLDRRFRRNTYLNTFCIHFVILLCLRPVESRVPLFADKQVREVDFLELKVNRLDELGSDEGCSLGSCATRPVLSRIIARSNKETHRVP